MKKLYMIIALMFVITISKAQAPVNDNCSGAITLTPNEDCTPTTGDVLGAHQSLANCVNADTTGYNDVWYSFSTALAVTGQEYVITVVGSTNFDPAFQVLKLTCNGTQATGGCVNANSTQGGTETVTLTVGVAGQLVSGATYFVRVYNATAGVPGTTTFTICVTLPPLNNDDTVLGSAGPITLTPTVVCTPTNSPANLDGATPTNPPLTATTCGAVAANDDVWYTYTAATGASNVTVVGSGGYDPQAMIYSGSPGGIYVTCTPLSVANGTASVCFQTIPGNQYWIRVFDASGTTTNGSTFTICVTFCTTLGITEPQEETSITIAPNPFTSETTITFSEMQKNTIIKVYDVLGREVNSQQLTGNSAVLDMSAQAKGIYFVQITSLDKLGMTNVVNRKVVVQ